MNYAEKNEIEDDFDKAFNWPDFEDSDDFYLYLKKSMTEMQNKIADLETLCDNLKYAVRNLEGFEDD